MAKVWECIVSDGTRKYFTSEVEAHFYTKDTVGCGFSVITHTINVPRDAHEFADFLDRLEMRLIRPMKKLADDCDGTFLS